MAGHFKMTNVNLFFIILAFTSIIETINSIDIMRGKSRFPGPAETTMSSSVTEEVKIVAVLPHTSFGRLLRAWSKALTDAVKNVHNNKYVHYSFTKYYALHPEFIRMSLDASPLKVLETLCQQVLPIKPTVIFYLTNSLVYGANAASAQYMLQLTGYLGIPVIAWNADNVGLEQRVSDSRIIQLAPTIEHQAQLMLNILRRYSWHTFSIITSKIGGHEDFIRAIRDLTQRGIFPDFNFDILDILILKSSEDEYDIRVELEEIADSEARIFLLFASRDEGKDIMSAAEDLGLTGKNYIWIASHSVVGTAQDVQQGMFPRGMLGIYSNVTNEKMEEELERAVYLFASGLESFFKDVDHPNISLSPNLGCDIANQSRWIRGDVIYKYMRNVTIHQKIQGRTIQVLPDGTLKEAELYVMNLNNNGWEKIGKWENNTLDIKDITWPGDSPVPPPGVPEKFNLKVTFLEEPPYVNLLDPDNETGECKTSRSVRCRVAPESQLVGLNHSVAVKNPNFYRCCSGFCIDLLQKFSQDLKFTFDLYKVEDGAWGVVNNGTWNGLIADLLHHKADIVVTSIKINSERQKAVDFTVPFLETGIAIVVAKRTGIISPKAFLEPFDTISWLMILLVSIQGAAFAIFLFEWLSPYGYDMKMVPPREHKFSLFRTYWLVWAVLFGAAVNVDCPRGYTARFMSSVWAMFAVVFLAIYTANLAAFMITREEYYDLTGIDDKRLRNPYLTDPPFRYGTIPDGNTQAILKKYKPELYSWMKKFNRSTVVKGIAAVKREELDAFIYDATVLEYLAGQDNECRLLTVGSWYAMTGYGFALPKKSKYLGMFNKAMIQYRENGDLERLQRFWLQGACKPKARKRNVSKPLDVNQFMSAFLLLGAGILLTILVLLAEHIYFKYIRKHLAKSDKGGYLTLISLSMGKSLSFRGAVYEATEIFTNHKCKDSLCNTTLRKTREDLYLANKRIKELEARNALTGVRVVSPNDLKSDPLKTRDMTKNYIMSNEVGVPGYKTHPLHSYGPHFIKTTTTSGDVAEIETVL